MRTISRFLFLSLPLLLFAPRASAQFVTIPDPGVRSRLLQNYPQCFNASQALDTTCAAVVNETALNVSGTAANDLTGVQYFDNLQYLSASSNGIFSMPKLPAGLIYMDISYSQVAFPLTGLPATLQMLICNNNSIPSIAALPSSLKLLEATTNQLTSLPAFPAGLDTVRCGQNKLTSLPALPATMVQLSAYQNMLTNVPALPSTLQSLSLLANMIPSLPALSGLTNLIDLDVSYNQLTTLPALPSNLTNFNCSGNQLTTLPTLPSNLSSLTCFNNQLSSLPALPSTLGVLFCNDNPLQALPTLPNNLKQLNCSNNQLSALPTLPSLLEELVCTDNQLTALPALPNGMYTLKCDRNQLTSLPAMPLKLYELRCSYNQLASIPFLYANIRKFFCDHNAIVTFTNLPNGLLELYASYNSFASLPLMPNTLFALDCRYTPMVCLPAIPSSLMVLYVANSFITCLPNYTQFITANGTGLPLCNAPCLSSGQNNVAGIVYADLNCNQQQDAGDIALSNIMLSGNSGGITSSIGNGVYSFIVPANSTTTFQPSAMAGYSLTPSSGTVTTTAVVQNFLGNDFRYCPNGTFDNFRVTLTPENPARPGFVGKYAITFENRGMQVQNAVVKFYYQNALASAQTSPIFTDGGTVVGDTIVWNISNLPLFTPQTKHIQLQIDATTQLGMIFEGRATVAPTAADADLTDNISNLYQTVVGSYDPNDKTVQHEIVPTSVAMQGMDLRYTIRFQNTGTDTAFTVIVRDTLSDLLDVSSLKMLAASHNYSLTVLEGKVLQWYFANINLLDSTSNEPESHGFITFSIRSKPQTSLQEIGNRAAIYFDFNAPIITNTATTSFATSISREAQELPVRLAPNPTSGSTRLAVDAEVRNYSVKITDLAGRTLIEMAQQSGSILLPTENLAAGTYFIRIQSEQGVAVRKLVKE